MQTDPRLDATSRIIVDPRVSYAARGVLAIIAVVWGALSPMVQLLLVFMVMDIITGILAAFYTRTLSSSASWKGMAKKAMILCLVGVATTVEKQSGLPIASAVAGFYLASETLSITENAAEMGVPIPQILRDALMKVTSEPAPLRQPSTPPVAPPVAPDPIPPKSP